MTITQLIAEFRERFDDKVTPYQVSDAAIILWANESQIEACRRARLLSDSTFMVGVVSGQASYEVPDCTIQIRRAKLANEELPLDFMSSGDMDQDIAGWESHTGTPTDIITDFDTNLFTIYPIPTANDTLNLVVIREPDEIASTSDSLEIPNRFHYCLIEWVLYRAYQVRDTDSENKGKSLECLAAFEQEFGVRSSAKDEQFNLQQRPYSNSDGFY